MWYTGEDGSKLELIRCNECIYWDGEGGCSMFPESELWFEKSFCAWALRRDDANN